MHVAGALLKAVFVSLNVVRLDLDAEHTLERQLTSRYGGGFELHSWSTLPHGSGLGTSSILAGVIMAVLGRVVGQTHSASSLIHAVSKRFRYAVTTLA